MRNSLSSADKASALANRFGARLKIFLRAEAASANGGADISSKRSLFCPNLDAASLKHDNARPAAASRTPP